jgi:hypothetical protein
MDIVMRIIFLLMFGGLGVMLVVVGIREMFRQHEMLLWSTPVQATVLAADVVSRKSSDTDNRPLRDNSTTSHSPEVRFAYRHEGKDYESSLLYPTVIERGYADRASAQAELDGLVVGRQVQAFVNPARPEHACLRLEHTHRPLIFIIVGGVSVIAGILAFIYLGKLP